MDAYERIADIFIGILIILIFPLIYFGLKQDSMTQTIVDVESEKLVDEIRGKGYLSKDMYDNYLDDLSGTGLLYDIEIEQRQRILEPEYRFRTLEEIIEDQNNAYTGTNTYHYHPIETFPPEITDPIDNSGLTMNTETNESVLAAAVNTPATPGHVHTDECYAGHKHKPYEGFTHIHAHDSWSCRWYQSAEYYEIKCNECGVEYGWYLVWYYMDQDTYRITPAYNTEDPVRKCLECSGRNINISYEPKYSYSCGYNTDADGDGFNEKVEWDVPYTYENCNGPQTQFRETYYSGCYVYHQWYAGRSISPFLTDDDIRYYTIMYMKNDGIHNYCQIPEYYTFGFEEITDDDDTNGYTWRYEITYRAIIENGQLFFRAYQYPDLTVSQLLDAMTSTQALNNLIKSVRGYEINTDYNKRKIFNISGSLLLCDYPREEHNRWLPICGYEEDATLVCDKKVKTLVPTHPVQAVYVGEALITTAVATYVDGSTKTVVCTMDFTATEPVTSQTVILSHVDELGTNHTCTITVTMVPKSKVCVNGHTYNLTNEGLDPGCPYCREYVSNLRIEYPVTSSIDIYRGTTLSENGVTLLATYMDGHTQLLQNEYVDNLDKFYIGTQYVTLSYRGKYCYLTVNNKRNIKLCPICNRYYELYPDDTDPGCPHCALRTPIFTGNVLEYYDKRYMDEILRELYEGSGTYYFSDRDYIILTVKNIRGSWGSRLLTYILNGLDDNNINVIKGGYIRENGNEYE